MNLDFSEEQEALRDAVASFFEKKSPTSVVRAAEPSGFDPVLWKDVLELGLPSIAVPAEKGGGGSGFLDLALAAEVCGRTLAPVPLVEAGVANALVSSLGSEALVESVVAGTSLITLALHPVVDGMTRLVPAGAVADHVVALCGDELLLVAQPEHARTAVPNLAGMPLSDCRVDGAETVLLATGADAVNAHRRAVQQWQALTAVALMGLTARALELAVEYVLERKAFGTPIGSFQSIQHRLADDATALEGARLLTYEAVWAQDVELPNAPQLAGMAFLFASETAFKTASDSLHFHGGYGYTLEFDIQLFFRRAKGWALIAGDRRSAYADLAHQLFDGKG